MEVLLVASTAALVRSVSVAVVVVVGFGNDGAAEQVGDENQEIRCGGVVGVSGWSPAAAPSSVALKQTPRSSD